MSNALTVARDRMASILSSQNFLPASTPSSPSWNTSYAPCFSSFSTWKTKQPPYKKIHKKRKKRKKQRKRNRGFDAWSINNNSSTRNEKKYENGTAINKGDNVMMTQGDNTTAFWWQPQHDTSEAQCNQIEDRIWGASLLACARLGVKGNRLTESTVEKFLYHTARGTSCSPHRLYQRPDHCFAPRGNVNNYHEVVQHTLKKKRNKYTKKCDTHQSFTMPHSIFDIESSPCDIFLTQVYVHSLVTTDIFTNPLPRPISCTQIQSSLQASSRQRTSLAVGTTLSCAFLGLLPASTAWSRPSFLLAVLNMCIS